MHPRFSFQAMEKAACSAAFSVSCEPICKPGSVLTVIYLGVPLPARSSHLPGETGPVIFPSTVLLRIEFTAPDASTPAGELLPHLSTLTRSKPGGISLLHLS